MRNLVPIVCATCGKTFQGRKTQAAQERAYCSRRCTGTAGGRMKHAGYDTSGTNNPNYRNGSYHNPVLKKQLERERHPQEVRARELSYNARRRGVLRKQPCSSCGSTDRVEAHHPDYDEPLHIIWLCHNCHREIS